MAHINVRIKVDEDGGMPELAGRECIKLQTLTVTSLDRGTSEGKPSMAFIFDLPDGRFVFAETTLALFLTVADALKGAHGDPRD